jgi:hypothetical protein
MTRLLHHLRHNVIAYLALGVALGAGGGYAVAASRTKTITVCVDKRTGVLHLHHFGRCKRGQSKLSWNQQGPIGQQGPQGIPGTPAPRVWAVVAGDGTISFDDGEGLSAQHVGPGKYQIAVTDPTCAQGFNAPTVTVSDANPPNGETAGAFPVAWIGDTAGNKNFVVFTGVVAGGTFSATDHTFNVVDGCS